VTGNELDFTYIYKVRKIGKVAPDFSYPVALDLGFYIQRNSSISPPLINVLFK